MSRRPAPVTGRGGPPGLHIDLGRHTHPWRPDRGWWLSQPSAAWRCRAGCSRHASGAAAVARLLARLADGDQTLHDPAQHEGTE